LRASFRQCASGVAADPGTHARPMTRSRVVRSRKRHDRSPPHHRSDACHVCWWRWRCRLACRHQHGGRRPQDRVHLKSQGQPVVTDPTTAALHEAFGRILERANSSATSRIITVELLEAIALAVRCEWAVFWEVHPAGKFLYAAVLWKDSQIAAQDLEQDTYARQLTMSEGAAGQVWRSRKPTWTTDIVRDMCLPRSLHAKQAGLQGGVWIPLKTVNAVYGVLELLGRHPVPARADTVVAVERLAVSLGCLMEAALFDGLAPRRT
jgi:hypothetical protein